MSTFFGIGPMYPNRVKNEWGMSYEDYVYVEVAVLSAAMRNILRNRRARDTGVYPKCEGTCAQYVKALRDWEIDVEAGRLLDRFGAVR